MKLLGLVIVVLFSSFVCLSQVKVMTFQEAEAKGMSFVRLDSLYKSAVHSDEKLAVFKSEADQLRLQKAYQGFIINLAKFLKENNFKWGKVTRCFNRIYFQKDGTVDYFLFNFPPDEVVTDKQKEFQRLLTLFIKDHKIGITADEKFAQCSPIKYNDL